MMCVGNICLWTAYMFLFIVPTWLLLYFSQTVPLGTFYLGKNSLLGDSGWSSWIFLCWSLFPLQFFLDGGSSLFLACLCQIKVLSQFLDPGSLRASDRVASSNPISQLYYVSRTHCHGWEGGAGAFLPTVTSLPACLSTAPVGCHWAFMSCATHQSLLSGEP